MLLKQNMLLLGKPGLSMRKDAEAAAKEYLGVKNIETHPDFLFVAVPDGKKSIGVDDIADFMKIAYIKPSISEKSVIIIDGIDAFTVQAQNRVLKVLEDCSNIIVIAISYGGMVLATIKSRLLIYEYHPLSAEEFIKKYDSSDSRLLFYATGGCDGLIPLVTEHINTFREIKEVIENGQIPKLLGALHLLKEKDNENLAGTPIVPNIIDFLIRSFSELLMLKESEHYAFLYCKQCADPYRLDQLRKGMRILSNNREICQQNMYSKDNYFSMIKNVIMAFEEE